jgi:hypothetical protein
MCSGAWVWGRQTSIVTACRRNPVLVLAEKAFGVRLRPAKGGLRRDRFRLRPAMAGLRRDRFSRFAEREQKVAKSEFGLASELRP